MGEFLVELDGCLYDNPEDVVEEFNKLRAERDALKAAMREAMRLLDQSEPRPEAAFSELLMALNPTLQSAKNKAAIDAARGK